MQNKLYRIASFLSIVLIPFFLDAQVATSIWSAEEQRELYGYCQKPGLMQQFNVSAETADKIGNIQYWVFIYESLKKKYLLYISYTTWISYAINHLISLYR